jgi:uncharacterized protein YlxP (DUF503 family)
MNVGVLILTLRLPGCSSLKEKRGRLKPLLARMHREFNVSAAEIDSLENWQQAVIAVALVSNEHNHNQRALQKITRWVDQYWGDVELVDDHIEYL